MLHDPIEVKSRPFRPFRPRRTHADRLQQALLMLAEVQGTILSHRETPWASITFSGTRHEVMLDFSGPEAVAAGERFIAALPDHEFTIPGQLVADATVSEASHAILPEPRLLVTATLLLLDEL